MEKIIVLIVDDCSGMLSVVDGLVTDYFEERGIPKEILTAENGMEALKCFNKSAIDIMITDLKMPGISGEDLIREVKILSPSTFSILMTAKARFNLPEDFASAVGLLKKPFTAEELDNSLRSILKEFI